MDSNKQNDNNEDFETEMEKMPNKETIDEENTDEENSDEENMDNKDDDEEEDIDKEEEDDEGKQFDMENDDEDDENQSEDNVEIFDDDDEGDDDDMTVEDGEINVDKNTKIKKNETLTLGDIDIIKEDDDEEDEDDEQEEDDDEEESDYSSDEEDNKMTEDINEKKLTLLDFHHECEQINYKELLALSKVIKKRGKIIDSMHQTIPILTRFERSKILGLRTKQLNDGAEPFYEVPSNIIDSYYIAEQELQKKLLPFIIKRPVNNKSEYWKLADLKIL